MDYKLLEKLFKTPSISGKEQGVINIVTDELKKMNVDFQVDDLGNIYNTDRKNRPLLSAHMDTVQDDVDAILTSLIEIKNGKISGHGVIGGDDKCGIYIILDLLKNKHDINFIFSVQEEVGGIGIGEFVRFNEHLLDDIPYGLILDRQGNSDIICYDNYYGSQEFEDVLYGIGKVFGFKPNSGIFSDADYLSDYFSCANISVGYYNPHTAKEYVVLKDLQNSLNFVHHILNNVTEEFSPVPYEEKKKSYYGGYFLDDYPLDEYDLGREDENNYCDICGMYQKTLNRIESLHGFFICDECLLDIRDEVTEKAEMIRVRGSDIDFEYYDYDFEELEDHFG